MSAPVRESSDRPLILLVDDEPAIRLMMARALTDRGHDVHTAADGQSAITILGRIEDVAGRWRSRILNWRGAWRGGIRRSL
jgi:PleD family two-component response regulator